MPRNEFPGCGKRKPVETGWLFYSVLEYTFSTTSLAL
jgi:hypothetical protein